MSTEELERCRERDEEVLEKLSDAFRIALEELLPRVHLYVLEHGPGVLLNADVHVVFGDTLAGGVELSIAEPPPRTYSQFGINEPPRSIPCPETSR